jgi:hypothetical protein
VGCIWQQRNRKNAESRTDLKREKNGETVELPARSLHLTGEDELGGRADSGATVPRRGGDRRSGQPGGLETRTVVKTEAATSRQQHGTVYRVTNASRRAVEFRKVSACSTYA